MTFPDATFSDTRPAQRTVPAAGLPIPSTTAAASVFPPKPKRAPSKPAPPLDPQAVPIRRGEPIPSTASGHGAVNRYGQVLARMEPGDMAEFADRKHANAMQQAARKAGRKTIRRELPGGKFGVWLMAS